MIKTEQFAQLAKKLHIQFTDLHLLARAFTHRSFLNEHRNSGLEHNERLEFLGDAVLELVVTDFLYKNYPNSCLYEGNKVKSRNSNFSTQRKNKENPNGF